MYMDSYAKHTKLVCKHFLASICEKEQRKSCFSTCMYMGNYVKHAKLVCKHLLSIKI